MREIDSTHRYEFDPVTGTVKDCFGDRMVDVDEFVEELNMLMSELAKEREKNQKEEK